MNDAITRRAAAISSYVADHYVSPDPDDLRRLSLLLASWDAARLQRDGAMVTADDDRRFAALTVACQDLSERVGLSRDLTFHGGYLTGCASDRIVNDTWQEAAAGW